MCTNASRSRFPNRAIDRTDPAWRSSRAVSLSSQQRSPSTWTPGPARTASAELCPGTASDNEIDGPSTARPVPPVRASPTLTPSIAGHTMRPAVSAAAVGSEPLNVSEPVFDTIEKGEKDDYETVSRSRRRKRRTRSPTSNHRLPCPLAHRSVGAGLRISSPGLPSRLKLDASHSPPMARTSELSPRILRNAHIMRCLPGDAQHGNRA